MDSSRYSTAASRGFREGTSASTVVHHVLSVSANVAPTTTAHSTHSPRTRSPSARNGFLCVLMTALSCMKRGQPHCSSPLPAISAAAARATLHHLAPSSQPLVLVRFRLDFLRFWTSALSSIRRGQSCRRSPRRTCVRRCAHHPPASNYPPSYDSFSNPAIVLCSNGAIKRAMEAGQGHM
ncbi:hypothetical protein BDZ89DRAFT_339055 [Hymenopellis radicata]|nr:hypothetical protein BDZ89DRAFT_339055 [Hymenopellis radicata]